MDIRLTDQDRAEVVRLYTTPLEDGTWLGTPTIARKFGVSVPCIQACLARANVQTRTSREAFMNGKRCKPITNLPLGEAPLCRCGCGAATAWNRGKNRWNRYVDGHYQPPIAPAVVEHLRRLYVDDRLTLREAATRTGISVGRIKYAFRKADVPLRNRSESRLGRKVGSDNHAWKGGVADWDYSSDWKTLARRIRDRDEWTCQFCGEQRVRWGRALHVHHIDEDKLNNDPANLVSLCASCHRTVHGSGVR